MRWNDSDFERWSEVSRQGRFKVLLVEPDFNLLSLVQRHLHWQGYEVFSIRDRRSAERLLQRMPISLLLTSLVLGANGEPEGEQLLSLVRRHRPSVKTILFTGAPSPTAAGDPTGEPADDLVNEAARYGADACLTKPIDLEQLRLTILDLLRTG